MSKKYNDRGIEKWAAFNSVIDTGDLKEEADKTRKEIEDKLNEKEYFEDI
jgi:hypothetical protein